MIQFFRTIKNKDSKQAFGINVELQNDNFTLTLLEKNNAWEANVSLHEIEEFAEQFSLANEEYFSKLKTYLLEAHENIEFRFAKAEFSCFSKAKNGLNLKYFTIKLRKAEFKFNLLLEKYSLECEKLRQQNENLIQEKNQIKEDNINLENKLTELITKKLKDEEELYSNFVLVLNEKKRKIQQLNQLLQAFKAGRAITNPQVKLKTKSKKNVKEEIKEEVSESESETYDTDEEKEKFVINDEEILLSTSKKDDFSSYFKDEDSPTYMLPKRVKTNNLDHARDIPSTSKIHEDKPEVSKMEVEEDSPKIGFNSTQDLLDCI